MWRPVAALALLASLLVGGCGSTSEPGAESVVGSRLLRTGAPAYDDVRLTWAQGSTLYYGDDTFDVAPSFIHGVVPTPYGWFLDLARSDGLYSKSRWVFFDGETQQPISAEAEFVTASPDGRYAGWIDRDGPDRPAGQVATAVVVDLDTGRVALNDSDGMGGDGDSDLGDLYAELPPTFLGFDKAHAYWMNAEGDRVRWSPETDQVGPAQREDEAAPSGTVALGHPYDRYAGGSTGVLDGKPEYAGLGGYTGSLAPDGRTLVRTGRVGKLAFFDAETGQRLRLRSGHRFGTFGSWLGDEVAFLSTDKRSTGYDLDESDLSRGFLTRCSLTTLRCSDVEDVTGTHSLVFPSLREDFLL